MYSSKRKTIKKGSEHLTLPIDSRWGIPMGRGDSIPEEGYQKTTAEKYSLMNSEEVLQ